jgi:DNA-binding NarL/FixJ family response regulator
MELPARLPKHSSKRSKHPRRNRQRRNRSFLELSSSSDQVRDAHPRPPVSIALIDPKPLTRQSLLKMLSGSLPEHVALVGASTSNELIRSEGVHDTEAKRNLIIVYIRSAGVTDKWVQDQLQLIKARWPEIPVIVISDRDDAYDVISALNHGVRGYIPTSTTAEVAIAALTLIEAGGTYVPADALRTAAFGIPGNAEEEQGQTGVQDQFGLTPRELSVIDLLRQGKPNKVIALQLDMSESTVKVHVRNILKKLRVTNRTGAAMVANRLLAQRATETNGLTVITDGFTQCLTRNESSDFS